MLRLNGDGISFLLYQDGWHDLHVSYDDAGIGSGWHRLTAVYDGEAKRL